MKIALGMGVNLDSKEESERKLRQRKVTDAYPTKLSVGLRTCQKLEKSSIICLGKENLQTIYWQC